MAIGTQTDALLSDRVKRLKDRLLNTESRLSCERLRALIDAWKESEGYAPVIRSARVLDKYLRGMTLYIDENPIVGSLTKDLCGCNPYPEWTTAVFDPGQGGGGTIVDPADEPLIKEAVDYFSTRCFMYQSYMDAARRHPDVNLDGIRNSWLWVEHPFGGGPIGGTNADYGKVLNIGLEGVIEEARAEMDKLFPGYLPDFRRLDFLKAVIIVCEAVIAWAGRYADLAADMAAREQDLQRKQELEEIAEVCRRVPAKPARNFREAIQSTWFIQLAVMIEAHQVGFSPGRFCQYIYPFYKISQMQGQSREESIELLELLFIKFTEIQRHSRKTFWEGIQLHQGQNLNIGGLTADGSDATNEVDFLVVEAYKRVRLIQPSLTLLWHHKLSSEFLNAVVDLVKSGLGQPAIVNCDVAILRLMDKHNISLQEAREFSVIACVDAVASHATDNIWESAFNMPKLLEIALNNGRDPRTGDQIGLQTGEARDFTTYEELHQALRQQLEYFLPIYRELNLVGLNRANAIIPVPFISALVDDCIKRGKDMLDGGARYTTGDGANPVAVIDVANSLAAIKKLVFEEKKLTLAQVMDAMQANFQGNGHGEVQSMLVQAPKYGNDDAYVDSVARQWYDIFCEIHNRTGNHLGEDEIMPYALSVALHFMFGSIVGALPSGRKAFIALTDGSISATPGTDRSGPTALLNSAVKVLDPQKYATTLLNMKLHPTVLGTREGVKRFLDLITTYMDNGGYHIQFNIVDHETLREAQRHPEDHRGLVVRVAGYSAFFVGLSPEMQDEVVRRTEYDCC